METSEIPDKKLRDKSGDNVNFIKRMFMPFRIFKKVNILDKINSSNTEPIASVCKKCKNPLKDAEEKNKYCETCLVKKNRTKSSSSLKGDNTETTIIEDISGKWEVSEVPTSGKKRRAEFDSVHESSADSKNIYSNDNVSTGHKRYKKRLEFTSKSFKQSDKYEVGEKKSDSVPTETYTERDDEGSGLTRKWVPSEKVTSLNVLGTPETNVSESSLTRKWTPFSCKIHDIRSALQLEANRTGNNEKEESFNSTSNYKNSTSTPVLSPAPYLSRNHSFDSSTVNLWKYRDRMSSSPSPTVSNSCNLNRSYDSIRSSPRTPLSYRRSFRRDKFEPVYKDHQLIGDSQFVRFSQQILHYRYVNFTPRRSRYIGLCVSGQTIEDLLNRIRNKEHPVSDKVVLMIGTNNLKKKSSLRYMIDNMKSLLDEIKISANRIVILTVPPIPMLETEEKHWMLLETFNNFLLDLHNGTDIFVVDIAKYYCSNYHVCNMDLFEKVFGNSTRPDRIHLNNEGLKLLKKNLDTFYFHKYSE